jgi:hypothetical protein
MRKVPILSRTQSKSLETQSSLIEPDLLKHVLVPALKYLQPRIGLELPDQKARRVRRLHCGVLQNFVLGYVQGPGELLMRRLQFAESFPHER